MLAEEETEFEEKQENNPMTDNNNVLHNEQLQTLTIDITQCKF